MIRYLNDRKATITAPPDTRDVSDAAKQMSAHRALSMEIQVKRRHYRQELERIESRLDAMEYDFDSLERLRARVQPDEMFDRLERMWLAKLAQLKDNMERSKFMMALRELDTQHAKLVEQIESFHETQTFYLQQKEDPS
eukprot:395926_1